VRQVFISYRREDTAGHALLIKDALSRRLADVSIFLDVDSIPVGVNFVKHVRERIGACEVVLVVIGDEWLCTRDGRRRLHEEHDHVRTEIREALQGNVRTIPVLVERAVMPPSASLPEDIGELARINALEIFDRTWQQDIERLVDALETARIPASTSTLRASSDSTASPRASSLPRRLTDNWLTDNVPRLSRSELSALLAELRGRGYLEADVERTVRRSRFRPPKKLPPRVTQTWLEESVPLMSTGQIRQTLGQLADRGWTKADIRQRVLPLAATVTLDALPKRVTMAFLEERAMLLPPSQARDVARAMRERGWDEQDIEDHLPRAT